MTDSSVRLLVVSASHHRVTGTYPCHGDLKAFGIKPLPAWLWLLTQQGLMRVRRERYRTVFEVTEAGWDWLGYSSERLGEAAE